MYGRFFKGRNEIVFAEIIWRTSDQNSGWISLKSHGGIILSIVFNTIKSYWMGSQNNVVSE